MPRCLLDTCSGQFFCLMVCLQPLHCTLLTISVGFCLCQNKLANSAMATLWWEYKWRSRLDLFLSTKSHLSQAKTGSYEADV